MLRLLCKTHLLRGLLVALSFNLPLWQQAWAQEIVPEQPARNQVKMQTGWIDAITTTDIVIDDLDSPLSGVTVIDQNGFTVDVSSLVVGRYVAFNRDGEKTTIRLLAEKGKRPELPEGDASQTKLETKKDSIRQVDGVWKKLICSTYLQLQLRFAKEAQLFPSLNRQKTRFR